MTKRYKADQLICPRYQCDKRGTHCRCYSDQGLRRYQTCKIYKQEKNPKRIARLERKDITKKLE